MRAREYDVLARAIEEGVAAGMRRAHKHTPTPTHELIEYEIHNGVMLAICEVFDFDDSPDIGGIAPSVPIQGTIVPKRGTADPL